MSGENGCDRGRSVLSLAARPRSRGNVQCIHGGRASTACLLSSEQIAIGVIAANCGHCLWGDGDGLRSWRGASRDGRGDGLVLDGRLGGKSTASAEGGRSVLGDVIDSAVDGERALLCAWNCSNSRGQKTGQDNARVHCEGVVGDCLVVSE